MLTIRDRPPLSTLLSYLSAPSALSYRDSSTSLPMLCPKQSTRRQEMAIHNIARMNDSTLYAPTFQSAALLARTLYGRNSGPLQRNSIDRVAVISGEDCGIDWRGIALSAKDHPHQMAPRTAAAVVQRIYGSQVALPALSLSPILDSG